MLVLFEKQLVEQGYKLPSPRSLKPKHVQHLVQRWQAEGLGAGTIKNRMVALRWWADKVNKASVIPRTNAELGIEERTKNDANIAQKLDLEKVNTLPCDRMRLAVRMMAAFGLRMEEALKFKPRLADKGDCIALKASWCKGGRERQVPVTLERQRELLAEVKAVCGAGSLIPDDKSYIQHRKALEHQTLKAGLTNLHGLRHNYAQVRYKALTGWECPKRGGMLKQDMDEVQRDIDKDVRLKISEELGHSRLEITKVYLG